MTTDSDILDRSRYPTLDVFPYPRNDLLAHRVAARIERVLEMDPDIEGIPPVFFQAVANLP